MRLRHRVLAFLATFPLSAACSDRHGDPAAVLDEPVGDCDQAIAALRMAARACCDASEREEKLAAFESWCRPQGQALADPDRLVTCLERHRELWARCDDTEELAECLDLFEPLRRQGDLCSSHDQCQARLLCLGSPPTCTPTLGPGDPCVQDEDDEDTQGCGPEMYCVDGACVEPRPEGEHCSSSEWPPCADGLVCAPDEQDAGSHCVALRDEGEPCGDLGPFCRTDLGCIDGTCAPARAEGEECRTPGDCARSLTCDPSTNRCTREVQSICWTPCLDRCED